MIAENGILVAGGYGVVGQQITQLIRQQHPNLPLLIAGRDGNKAEALARKLGNASSIVIDVEQPNPLQGVKPRAVVAVVNDPNDYLLMDAVQNAIPYLDVTRWTERLRTSVAALADKSLKAPVLFSSGWMGGITAMMAVATTQALQNVESIDISVLFSLKDKSGPNSVEYMDRLATPFKTLINGKFKQVLPYTDPRRVRFPNGYTTPVYRFDTPDQFTLPQTTGAKTVAARIAFDDAFSTNLLRFLTRSGIWKLISGDLFTSLRRSLLYNPGRGASHEIEIAVAGSDADGSPKKVITSLVDPQGQTHLTALGALIQLERLLGLDGADPPAPGIVYPDTTPKTEQVMQVLDKFSVTVSQVEDITFKRGSLKHSPLLPRHVAIIGAAGGLGQALVSSCREAGIGFTAIVRSRPERITDIPPGSRVAVVNSLGNLSALTAAFKGVDAVFTAVGVTSTSQDSSALLSENMATVEQAMLAANVKRIILINTLLTSPPGKPTSLVMGFFSSFPGTIGRGATEQQAVVNALGRGEFASLQWTLVRGGLNARGKDEAPVASLTWASDLNSWMPVSYKSMARWMLEEAAINKFIQEAPLVSLGRR